MNTIGWREWIELPMLGIPAIKAKVDTGALTSALHAFDVSFVEDNGRTDVLFKIHPLRKRKTLIINCRAPMVDRRVVRDSGGHEEIRPVISASVKLGSQEFTTEFTLTTRDDMLFKVLLGRRAIVKANAVVDVQQSYSRGRFRIRDYPRLLEELSTENML